MRFLEAIPIPLNGTVMVVGEIQHLVVPDASIEEQGHINLTTINNVGISGINSYYALNKIAQFPYARPEELPFFE